jgi:hypothetical protein
MRVLMLDTLREAELSRNEACAAIDARIAVEAPLGSDTGTRSAPETAVLDRAGQTMTKPRPQPRPAPSRETRRKRQ